MPTDADWDAETDILVVGSGAAGLTAAIVARDRGAKVMVIEKSDRFGGTSATSGGVIWIPDSPLADPAVHQDSAAEATDYLAALTNGEIAPERTRSFVENAPAMLRYMTDHTRLRYTAIPYVDYHAELPGGKLGYRSHEPEPMDGRLLGADLDRMRPNHPSAMLFGRISWTAGEVGPLISRSRGWLRMLARVLARYYLDVGQRLRSKRSRFLVGGNALIAQLKLSLDDRGVAIDLETRLLSLVGTSDGVAGAVIEQGGTVRRIRANRGVILASGGFERSADLRARHLPRSPDPDWSASQSGNVGDGLIAAQALGAATTRMDSAWWAPTIRVPGEESARPLFFERALPGCIIVDHAGHRYLNEAASYHVVGGAMMARRQSGARDRPSWIVFDAAFRWHYPMGPVMPMLADRLHARGVRDLVVKANSLDALADRTGLDRATLRDTVAAFNKDAARGEDPVFGRGHHAYDRYYGDPRVTPNPNLKPVERAPYYAIPIHPGDIGSNGGLATDGEARVLGEDGVPIAGLYAIGNVAASVMGRSYPGAGATLGPGMTFGYVAARQAAGQSDG